MTAAPLTHRHPGQPPMRIAMVTEHFQPEPGSADRSVHEIACILAARGHEVTLLSGGALARDVAHPWPYRLEVWDGPWVRAAGPLLRFRRWAQRRLDEGGFDCTLSDSTAVSAQVLLLHRGTVRERALRWGQACAGPMAKARRLIGQAMDLTLQLRLQLERRSLADPAVRAIVAPNSCVERELAQHYPVMDPDRVVRIPEGAGTPAPDPEQATLWRQHVREGLGLPDNAILLAFPSADSGQDGLSTLLRALVQVRQSRPEVVLLSAAPATFAHVAEAAALEVREGVRFLGRTQALHALFAGADLAVLPAHVHPSGRIVLEALLAGRPVVTTARTGAASFVANAGGEPAGRVLDDPGDHRALAEAILALCDPAERDRCTQAAITLRSRLSMENHVDELESLLRDVARETAARATGGPLSGDAVNAGHSGG